MFKMTDIYHKVSSNIASQYLGNFGSLETNEKKKIIDIELKKYLFNKIGELGYNNIYSNINELSVHDLMVILSRLIPKEEHDETLAHLTHYILSVAGTLQYETIIWMISEDTEYVAHFDKDNKWDRIVTSKHPDYVECFDFVYDVFNNKFLVETKDKSYKLSTSKKGLK